MTEEVGKALMATPLSNLELMAHLYRRAGFGATRDELELALAKGYERVVEELLHPEAIEPLDDEVMNRYLPDSRTRLIATATQVRWLFRMVNTPRPLEEKITLFWHALFATSFSKVEGCVLAAQIDTFRRNGLGERQL